MRSFKQEVMSVGELGNLMWWMENSNNYFLECEDCQISNRFRSWLYSERKQTSSDQRFFLYIKSLYWPFESNMRDKGKQTK